MEYPEAGLVPKAPNALFLELDIVLVLAIHYSRSNFDAVQVFAVHMRV